MIDFKKLMNRTSEEQEADARRMRQQDIEAETKRAELVVVRMAQLEQLNQLEHLSSWERQFVSSLSRRGVEYDLVTATEGGRLGRLSDKEGPIFERLVSTYLGKVLLDSDTSLDAAGHSESLDRDGG